MSSTTLVVSADLASAMPDAPATALAAMPAVVTAAVENYCQRPLALAARDEEYEPGTTRLIRLKGYPVVSIGPVLTDLSDVITIQAGPGPWRATISLDFSGGASLPTGLILGFTTGASSATTTLNFATYQTIAALASAINGTAGWSSTIAPNMGGCPCGEIRPVRGSYDALVNPAKLQAYVTTLGKYEVKASTGKLTLYQIRPDPYRYPSATWGVVGDATKVRVQYVAGYQGDPNQGTVTTPPDLAEACVESAAAILECRKVSGVISELNLGNTTITAGDVQTIPSSARRTLSKYVDRRF